MSKKVLSIVFVALMASVSFGQNLELAPPSDDGVNVVYNAGDGGLHIESTAGAMTTFELKSASEQFTGEDVNGNFVDLFDVASPAKYFKLDPAGYSTLEIPNALPTGLDLPGLQADLILDGSFAVGGALSTKPNILVVPEPSSIALLAFAGLGLLGFRRK